MTETSDIKTYTNNASLDDVNELLSFANEINNRIRDLEEERTRLSRASFLSVLLIFILALFELILSGSLFKLTVNIFLFSAIIYLVLLIYLSVTGINREDKFSKELTVESKCLSEIIDIMNSLLEDLEENSNIGVVPLSLTKMKLRRLSFSTHSYLDMKHNSMKTVGQPSNSV